VRPLIGVTTSRRSGWRIFPLVAFNVWLAGGRAVRWVAGRPSEVAGVDGIIIGGGDDISPDLYEGALIASSTLDPGRDEMEERLVCAAMAEMKPVLGICRGSQMLNVALGGRLDQDAYGTYMASERYWTILPKKNVEIVPGTRLAAHAGTVPMKVNALHSQAVTTLGRGLRVAARDSGGMIQAIERTEEPFALGVQWHPEHLFYAHRQRAIFRALVNAAAARRDAEAQLPRVDRGAPAPGSGPSPRAQSKTACPCSATWRRRASGISVPSSRTAAVRIMSVTTMSVTAPSTPSGPKASRPSQLVLRSMSRRCPCERPRRSGGGSSRGIDRSAAASIPAAMSMGEKV
jgi:putative glutamine amidotransferase